MRLNISPFACRSWRLSLLRPGRNQLPGDAGEGGRGGGGAVEREDQTPDVLHPRGRHDGHRRDGEQPEGLEKEG